MTESDDTVLRPRPSPSSPSAVRSATGPTPGPTLELTKSPPARPKPVAKPGPADTDTTSPSDTPKRRLTTGRAWIAVLSVLALGLLALDIWFFTIRSDNDDLASARTAAVANAKVRIPKMLSYSYKDISTFSTEAAKNATGQFRTSFNDLVKSVIVPAAKTSKIDTTATVKAIGIVRAQQDSVVLLAFIDQSTTTKTTTSARIDGSRVRVTMRHTGGTWLVADISPT